MKIYKIIFPFPNSKHKEVNISSENLEYAEICGNSGCQVVNTANEKLIYEKCKLIAELIREIDELNS